MPPLGDLALVQVSATLPEPRRTIAAPENNRRIWRNPELSEGLNRLRLRASASPEVPQVFWLVDGEPFAVAAAGERVYGPMRRLPLGSTLSRPVRIVVE